MTIFLYAHGKLDLTFVWAMPKLSCSAVTERKTSSLTEMCAHLSRNRRENINHEFSIKMFVCCNHIYFPNVGVTASKLVPRKEKLGSYGASKLFQINSTFLDVRLVIGVSIDIFLAFLFFCFFL